MPADMDSGVEPGMDSSRRLNRCPRGFSPLQIAVISVLKACRTIIAYWRIAQLASSCCGLHVTADAARGVVDRLVRRGCIRRGRAAEGTMQGNQYAFPTEPCPHIIPYVPHMESGMESAARAPAQSDVESVPSFLRKTDRKNTLSISFEEEAARRLEALAEGDIAFHWPELARLGFGTHQIRQICERLEQAGIRPERVMQGLTHAEWELAAGRMRDKAGQSIQNPVNWVFKILATQGYYPRPEGYVSPQEQAERDAAEEVKRVAEARKARLQAECAAWIAGLTGAERQTILAAQKFSMPDDLVLRSHYCKNIRPLLEGSHAPGQAGHNQENGHEI
jgi:hypothetical protein